MARAQGELFPPSGAQQQRGSRRSSSGRGNGSPPAGSQGGKTARKGGRETVTPSAGGVTVSAPKPARPKRQRKVALKVTGATGAVPQLVAGEASEGRGKTRVTWGLRCSPGETAWWAGEVGFMLKGVAARRVPLDQVQAVEAGPKPPPTELKGRWTGELVVEPDGGWRATLKRRMGAVTLVLEATVSGWSWKVQHKGTWWGAEGEDEGRAGALQSACIGAIQAALGLVASRCPALVTQRDPRKGKRKRK